MGLIRADTLCNGAVNSYHVDTSIEEESRSGRALEDKLKRQRLEVAPVPGLRHVSDEAARRVALKHPSSGGVIASSK